MNHIIEVLTGGASEKIVKWGHEKVSTYGIGKEHSRAEWAALGREIIRLGYCVQSAEKFSTLELTDAGRELLRARRAVTLTRPPPEPDRTRGDRTRRAGEIACDEALFEQLRTLRKEIADARDVPAYIVFSDVSLRVMAREYPTTERAFANITGVGTRKLDEFGAQFMDAIQKYLRENPRQVFADELDQFHGPPPKKVTVGTSRESWRMFAAGQSFEEIARDRGLSAQTVVKHVADAIEAGEPFEVDAHFSKAEQAELEAAFVQHSDFALAPVKEALGNRYDYSRLHLYRAARRARQR